MKKQNVLYGITLIAILSGCGINGNRSGETGPSNSATATEAAASPTPKPTEYETAKTITGKSSLGDTRLEIATGYISNYDSNYAYIGKLGYRITKTSINDSINGTMKTNYEDATTEFPAFLTIDPKSNLPVVVALINEDLKAKVLKPELYKKVTVIPTGKFMACETYVFTPQNVPNPNTGNLGGINLAGMKTFCNLTTLKCRNNLFGGEGDLDNVLRDPNQKCEGVPQEGYRGQKELLETNILSNVVIEMDPNAKPLVQGKISISISDSTLNFAL